MNVYLLHAIGIDGVQITEHQRENLLAFCGKTGNADKIVDINGYAIKVSAIMTIEPVDTRPKDYLIERYNIEASNGLHEPYKKRITSSERLAIEQGKMVEEALEAKSNEEDAKIWDAAPKRSQFTDLHEYIRQKSRFIKNNFNRKEKNG